MRAITKGTEPSSLMAHRKTPLCDYENYPGKDRLRHALVTEQQGLCCYCMGRIHNGPTTMKIEHWRSQARYPEDRLTYHNLLGACIGGQGQSWHLQHCDTRKGDRDLQWNPADPDHHIETRVRYELDGSIKADDPIFDEQLNDVLNLNHPVIKNNRKGTLTALLQWWKAEHKPVRRARLEREIRVRTSPAGDLTPYGQVAVWWLGQRLVRMTA